MDEMLADTANRTLRMDLDSSISDSSSRSLLLSNISNRSNMTVVVSENGTLEVDEIFLNTVTAQALSGIFVWSALLITCHQVSWLFVLCCTLSCKEIFKTVLYVTVLMPQQGFECISDLQARKRKSKP